MIREAFGCDQEAALGISDALFRQAEEYAGICGLSSTRSVGPGWRTFRAVHRPEAPGSGGVGLSCECRSKEAVGSGRTGWEGIRAWDQAIWNRSNDRADDRGGALAGKPRGGILAITGDVRWRRWSSRGRCSGQCSISDIEHPFEQSGQLRRAGATGGGASAGSAEGGWTLSGTLGMISGRSLALRPRRAKQAPSLGLASGTSTPWKRMRWSLGRGTSAARRCVGRHGSYRSRAFVDMRSLGVSPWATS